MKYLKLFENYTQLDSLTLEDVVGSVEDYIDKTYNVDNSIQDNPYGCDSKYHLEDDISIDNLWDEYGIDTSYVKYWKTENFIKMMSDEKCYVSLPYRFDFIKKEFQKLGNPVTVWRCMSVNKEFIDSFLVGDIRNLGKYWSYSKSEIAAQMHEKLEYLILFECEVDSKFIDYKKSILYNLNYSVGTSEKEIIIDNNAVLKLENAYVTTNISEERYFPFYAKKLYKILDISHLKNRDYYL